MTRIIRITVVYGVLMAFFWSSCSRKSSEVPVISGDPSASGVISFDEPVELEYLGWSNIKLDGSDSVYKWIENKFNMKLVYTSVPDSEYQNFSTMRIASGDIPEMFKTMVPNDEGLGVYRGLQLDNVLVNVSSYMDRYSFSNLEKIYEDPSVKLMRESDGYYMVPNYLGPSFTALYIRQDWVDALGLEHPKTVEEFKTFLRTIVKADLDGAHTTGLTVAGVSGLESLFSIFTGTSGNWIKWNGEWVHKVMHPGFREGIKYSAELYKEKLLDPEFAMLNRNNIQEKIASGKAASLFLNGTSGWYNPMRNALTAYKPNAELSVIVPWPQGAGGSMKPGGTPFFGAVHLNASSTEAQILRSLAFLDWQMTEESMDLYYYGIEGEHHRVVNGQRIIDEEAKRKLTYRDVYIFYDIINNFSQFKWLTTKCLIENLEWTQKAAIPDQVIGLSTDITMEIAPRLADIYQRWMVGFITGEKNVDTQWEAFLVEFKSAGYEKYQQEVIKYMGTK